VTATGGSQPTASALFPQIVDSAFLSPFLRPEELRKPHEKADEKVRRTVVENVHGNPV
jgi:hypothetical protein